MQHFIITDVHNYQDCTNILDRSMQKVKHTLEQADGTVTKTSNEPADVLANFFKLVFIHKGIQKFPACVSTAESMIVCLHVLVITEDLVHNKLSKLNL